ncbi:MAG: leucine-rich repeat domain-containing protein [Clostridiales bacterium]|nr:leucine-rich repeat domain-containing protein [Clostridiales bacterium]
MLFSYCYDLTSITIPNSVTNIGDGAFNDCYNLSDVYYDGTVVQWNSIEIENTIIFSTIREFYYTYIEYTYANDYLLNATIHCTDGDIISDNTSGDEDTDNTGNTDTSSSGTQSGSSTGSTFSTGGSSTDSRSDTTTTTDTATNSATANAVTATTTTASSTSTSTASVSTPKKTSVKKNNQSEEKVNKSNLEKGTGCNRISSTICNQQKIHQKQKDRYRKKARARLQKTIKGLKSKKTYYVRVRTYKTVNGKKVYSKWSTVKKVTVK